MRDDLTVDPDVRAVLDIAAVPRILDVVCRATGMGFAAVARVTQDRWISCASLDLIGFGLGPGDELEVESTLCSEIRVSRQPVVIDDVEANPEYRDHQTPLRYGFRSYISVPIVDAHGEFWGTLCAIDPQPRKLNTPETVGMFTLFAEMIAAQLASHETLARSEDNLKREKTDSQLREEFIAVLGHDLRNPIAAILSGVRLLERGPDHPQAALIIDQVKSSARRANGLIEDLLDFARGRLGGGLTMEPVADADLRSEWLQVIDEVRSITGAEIHADLDLGPVSCDRRRMGQLLSNLLSNAVTHGAQGQPVHVRAQQVDGIFTLSVANKGKPIPADVQASLFHPFRRGSHRPGEPGLGLGLYIASEIARAHHGTLAVASDEAETRFTLTMPVTMPAA